MTVSFVVLCASGSIIFGLLFGRLFAWWQEVKDEEQAMANASIRARFDANRYDDLTVDELRATAPDVYSFEGMKMTPDRRAVVDQVLGRVYDWGTE